LKRNTCLTSLDLNYNEIRDEGATWIGHGLQGNASLLELKGVESQDVVMFLKRNTPARDAAQRAALCLIAIPESASR